MTTMHDENAPETPQIARPVKQTTRGKSNCRCGAPCFYCGRQVSGRRHEHDHMPVPYRHGGTETVVACSECHRLKDRVPFDRWPIAAQDAATIEELRREPMFFAAMVRGAIMRVEPSDDPDAQVTADDCLIAIKGCTSAESRIATAKLYAQLLDIQASSETARASAAARMAAIVP